jgi:nucleotide-binding universal stress UspA family protein
VNVKIQRILFPTDFSQSAQQAQNYACELAKKFGAELHAMHIVPDPLPVPGPEGSWILPDESVPARKHEAELELAVRMEAALAGDVKVVRSVPVGKPVQVIIDYAKTHEIDLIVIGTHGHTGLSHLLLGSIAEKVVRLATCPVLTVHSKDLSSK